MTDRVSGLRVFVRGLTLMVEIGLNPDERGRRQPVVIDAMVTLAPHAPEHLRDTFNYEHVVRAARTLAEGGHIELVETFAHQLASAFLVHEGVQEATVSVGKPQALADADLAGAEITLRRG